MTKDKDSTPPSKDSPKLVDALELWKSEAGDVAPVPLQVARIDENERLFVPFTTAMSRVSVHYLDTKSTRGYIRCNGDDCLLCGVGRKHDRRDLLPVYDVCEEAVTILAISPSLRQRALRPQIQPVLERVVGGESPFLLIVSKAGTTDFSVSTAELPANASNGAALIATFLRQVEANEIDLTAVYNRLSNDVIAEIPEVAILMAAKGITV